MRQLEDRHLPGPAAIGVGVVVELIHDHEPHVGPRTLTQRDVGQDLGRAADDRGVRVDRRIAGQHADVVGAEDLTEREELLAHQRLDRCGVEAHAVIGERGEVGGDRDQRLAGAGRGGQHDVAAGHQLEDGLLLVRV